MADALALNVTFLGMAGAFSLPPLEALLAAGVAVREVVLPGTETRPVSPKAPESGLPVLTPYAERSIVHLAWERGLPVREVADLNELAAPDVLVVACFPRLIPRSVWSRPRLAVNIHPSLLPDNRGPAPLYWTFRLGQRRTGVTVHLLADQADAGDIVAQRAVAIPEGTTEAGLELQLARLGGDLLVQVLRDFERGQLRPVPQDESRATSHPWPSGD